MIINEFPYKNSLLVEKFQFVTYLDLSQNRIDNFRSLAEEDKFKYLQVLLLKSNRVNELTAIKAPNLLKLDLEDNYISKMDLFEGHPKLEELNMTKNKLNDLTLFKEMPNLKELQIVKNFQHSISCGFSCLYFGNRHRTSSRFIMVFQV